jgi:hypothetical protein
MTLVRRQKGDMTPLPEGVVARVQLTPYRIQLAGIRTSPVEYRRLEQEVNVSGLLEAAPGVTGLSALTLTCDVFETDASILKPGQEGRVSCDTCPDATTIGRIVEISPGTIPAVRRVKVSVDNPPSELRAGHYALAKFLIPVSRLSSSERLEADRWRTQLALTIATSPNAGVDLAAPSAVLIDAGIRKVVARAGYVLSVPESAVIDTGTRKVVYIESMANMYDAVEVRLGRRCGDYYPVRAGLEPGQRIASAGAVLLDAETRLNPSVAASYFGSGSRTTSPAKAPKTSPSAPSSPSPDDQQVIAKQKICPVSGGALDSMGGPVKLVIDGRVVFICCKDCEKQLRQKAALYLQKLPK